MRIFAIVGSRCWARLTNDQEMRIFPYSLVLGMAVSTPVDVHARSFPYPGGPADIKNHRWFSSLNWMTIFHQTVRPPYVPEVKSAADTRYFQMQEKEEHIHISGVDKYASLFKDF